MTESTKGAECLHSNAQCSSIYVTTTHWDRITPVRIALAEGTIAAQKPYKAAGGLSVAHADITRESLAAVTDGGRATYQGTLASVEARDDGDSGREHRTAPESSEPEGPFSLSSGIANKPRTQVLITRKPGLPIRVGEL